MGAKSLILCLLLSVASARRTQRQRTGANEGAISNEAEAAAAAAVAKEGAISNEAEATAAAAVAKDPGADAAARKAGLAAEDLESHAAGNDAPAEAGDPEEGALTHTSAKAAECSKALDLYFVIGCGLSCPDVTNWNKMKGFVMHIANQFRISDESMRASVVQWTPQGAHKNCVGVSSQEELLTCLTNAKITRGHSGHVDKALKIVNDKIVKDNKASKKDSSEGRQKYVIVLVDERNHYGGTVGHAQNIKKACNNDHCIISIAIGDDKANWNLVKNAKELASVPETAFHAPTYEDLGNMVQPVLDLVCPGTHVHGEAPQVSSPEEPAPAPEKPAAEEEADENDDGAGMDMFATDDDWD